jgi:hypothetical protein
MIPESASGLRSTGTDPDTGSAQNRLGDVPRKQSSRVRGERDQEGKRMHKEIALGQAHR